MPSKKTTLHKTHNPLSLNIREKMVQLLQDRLADSIDLQVQLKVAHWNVKGHNFQAIHELFDKVHGELGTIVDATAERLVSLGGQTHATVQNVAKQTTLTPYHTDITKSSDHIEAVSKALAEFAAKLHKSIEEAKDDRVTEDLFIGQLRTIDHYLWFVESHGM